MCISSHFFIQGKHSLEIVNTAATTSCQCYSPGNAIYLEGNPRMKFQSSFPYGFQLSPCFPWPAQQGFPVKCLPRALSSQQKQQSIQHLFSYLWQQKGTPWDRACPAASSSGADQASTPPKPGCSFTSHTNAHDSPNSAPTLQTVQPDSHRTVSTALCHLPFIVTALGKKFSPPRLSTVSELLVLLFLECNSFLNI